jgi:hypothetical protein
MVIDADLICLRESEGTTRPTKRPIRSRHNGYNVVAFQDYSQAYCANLQSRSNVYEYRSKRWVRLSRNQKPCDSAYGISFSSATVSFLLKPLKHTGEEMISEPEVDKFIDDTEDRDHVESLQQIEVYTAHS